MVDNFRCIVVTRLSAMKRINDIGEEKSPLSEVLISSALIHDVNLNLT